MNPSQSKWTGLNGRTHQSSFNPTVQVRREHSPKLNKKCSSMLHSDLPDGVSSVCSLASMKWINSNSQTAAASLRHWNIINIHPYICMSTDYHLCNPPDAAAAVMTCNMIGCVYLSLHVSGLRMQACSASHYMAAVQNMHHLTDSMWGAASAARSPAAARTQLASSWATGCWLLAPTQICFYKGITERRRRRKTSSHKHKLCQICLLDGGIVA